MNARGEPTQLAVAKLRAEGVALTRLSGYWGLAAVDGGNLPRPAWSQESHT